MSPFDAAQFQAEYGTKTGQALWPFLNRDDIVARMETASDLGQAALQAVEDLLLAEFGDAVLADRVKQMIGRMVRQVLEGRGFEHVTSDVRLNSVPFYKASRYRRRDQTAVYIFKNSDEPSEILISAVRNPALPPLAKGRWSFVNVLTSPLKAQIGYGFNLKVSAAQASQGPVRHKVPRLLRPGASPSVP